MEIMFDDLNQDAQQRLLKEAGVTTPKEMNWDEDPVAVVELETEDSVSEDDFMGEELLDDTYGLDGYDPLD